MSKKIAIIGASYLQVPLIKKAKEMGYETHVFAWEAGDIGEKEADIFYPISIIEKELILDKCQKIGICGICSIASDIAMITVNYVAEKMGLVGNSSDAVRKSTNKFAMRKAFEENKDPSAKAFLVDSINDLSSFKLQYPVIVKPTDRSGSRGITKITDVDMLKNAVDYAIKESFEKKALIEEFIEGKEYSVEFISYKGSHTFLALTEKFTTGEPHYIETGHLEPADVSQETIAKVVSIITHALDTLEIENGASHSEIKIDYDGNIRIIEIGGRMGGDCIGSDLVRYSTGYDYVRMVIDIACGKVPDFTKISKPVSVKVCFILTSQDLSQFQLLRDNNPDKILKVVDFHPERLGETTDSSNRAGCYIIRN